MNLHKLQKEVPFDQFSRQYQVAAILRELKGKSTQALRILDVGGYKGRTSDFLPAEEVTVLDLYKVQEKDYVQGSALDIPFEDASVDYVTSFDVLEHIPAEHREKFVAECIRVSRHGVIICAPHKSGINELAEQKLNSLYLKLHHKPHQWLKEHIENGIPDFSHIEKLMQARGYATVRFYSNKTQLWFAMQQAIFLNSKFSLGTAEVVKLNEYYNKNFLYDGGGSETTSYRQILCGLKSESAVATLEKKLGVLNQPIDPVRELELQDRLNEYYRILTSKTSSLADDYKGLYEYHRQIASDYETQNHILQEHLSKYEKVLPIKVLAKVWGILGKSSGQKV